MSARSKSKAKEQPPQPKEDDYRSYLTEGILRPPTRSTSSTEENTPSLQILPDYLQKWTVSSDPLPVISSLSLPNIYPILANILGIDDYQYNMMSFWFVDILGEAIRIAQDELQLSMPGQKLMVAWFINTLRSIKEKNLTREDVYSQVHLTMVTAEGCSPYTSLGVPLPTGGWDAPKKEDSETSKQRESLKPRATMSFQSVEMYSIAGLLWHIFANPFQYEVIKKVFCDTPPVQDVNIPFEINKPKLYKPAPLPEKKSAIKKPVDKKKRKAALEIPSEQEEQERLEKIQREKDLYILPLQEAVDDKYFQNLFNVPEEPESPKKKEKKDKKKN